MFTTHMIVLAYYLLGVVAMTLLYTMLRLVGKRRPQTELYEISEGVAGLAIFLWPVTIIVIISSIPILAVQLAIERLPIRSPKSWAAKLSDSIDDRKAKTEIKR